MISIYYIPALRTFVDPLRQGHLHSVSTYAAILRCIRRFFVPILPAGTFSLTLKHLSEHSPRCIRYRFVHPSVVLTLHLLDVKFLDVYLPEPLNKLVRQLKDEILSLVGNAFVHTSNRLLALRSLGRSFRRGGEFALCLRERFLFLSVESRISDLLSGRQSGKRLQANVDTYNFVGFRQKFRLHFAGEARKPLSPDCPANNDCLAFALKRSMQLDFDIANLGQPKLSVVNPDTVSKLRIGKAVVLSLTLEPGITRFLSGFDSAEERLERKVHSFTNILKDLAVNHRNKRIVRFDKRQLPLLFKIRQRLSSRFVGVLSLPQEIVIDASASFEGQRKRALLRLGWKDSIFERSSHVYILAQ